MMPMAEESDPFFKDTKGGWILVVGPTPLKVMPSFFQSSTTIRSFYLKLEWYGLVGLTNPLAHSMAEVNTPDNECPLNSNGSINESAFNSNLYLRSIAMTVLNSFWQFGVRETSEQFYGATCLSPLRVPMIDTFLLNPPQHFDFDTSKPKNHP